MLDPNPTTVWKHMSHKFWHHTLVTISAAATLGLALPSAGQPAPRPTGSSYVEAIRWYQDAAAAGNARAQFLLAIKYEAGLDAPQDLAAARTWYARAAEQNHPLAQFKLALMMERGLGGQADPAGAVSWYEAAAQVGLAPAQYNLAVAYLNGAGATRDRVRAFAWLALAERAGVEPAAALRTRLEVDLPPEELNSAKALAKEYADTVPAAPTPY